MPEGTLSRPGNGYNGVGMRVFVGRHAWLLGILSGALAVRLVLFTGVQGWDDLYYARSAHALLEGAFSPGSDLFATRLGFVVPIALSFSAFGIGSFPLVLPSLLGSLLLVLVAYRWGRELYAEETGRAAALVLAVLPLDVFHATEAHPDLLQAALIGLGAHLLWRSTRMERSRRALLQAAAAGLAFGWAYLVKESAALLVLPVLAWCADRRAWPAVGAALGILGVVILLELAVYASVRGDALLRFHAVQSQLRGIPAASGPGLGGRASELISYLFHPGRLGFVYAGGLFGIALAILPWLLLKDRARSGWVGLWCAWSLLLVGFLPASIVPYRPALSIFPRFLAPMALPAALLVARAFVVVLRSRLPRLSLGVAAGWGLLALVCAFRLHQDGALWREGAEWAHRRLSQRGGVQVICDPRSAEIMRFLGGYALAYDLRSYAPGDPPPSPGTILVDNERWVQALRAGDRLPPPSWWREDRPRRERVAEHVLPAPMRLRGSAPPPERIVVSVVLSDP